MTEPTVAERVRQERDLRPQVAGMGLENEVLFQHIRTGMNLVTLYAMSDGEPIPLPEKLIAAAMGKKDAEGNWMFTDKKEDAPEYMAGTVMCFLHAESVERKSGLLSEIGIAGKKCSRTGGLASEGSKITHGEIRHKAEWKAWKTFEAAKEKREDRDATRAQLDATLALAGKAADKEVVDGFDSQAHSLLTCDQCGKECKGKAGLSAHVRGAHGDVSE